MKFHGIEMVGKFINQREDTLPTWTSSDIARLLYVDDIGGLYFGNSSQYVAIVDCFNSQTIYGQKTFDVFPFLPSTYPTISTQAVNKKYVDDYYVSISELSNYVTINTDQTITGIKTFTQFPVLSSAYPTISTQAVNKKYVDDYYVSIGTDQTITGIKTFTQFPVLPNSYPTLSTHAVNKMYVDNVFSGAGSEPFPIGGVFLSVVSTNPNTLLGYGTWSRIGQGKMLIGVNEGDGDFSYAEKTGGNKTITLTYGQMPTHNHTYYDPGHVHGVVNDTHAHTITDPGHGHVTPDYPYGYYAYAQVGPGLAGTPNGGGDFYIKEIALASNVTGITHTDANSTGAGLTADYVGISIDNVGSYDPVNIMNPYICVYMWKRTA